MQELYRRLTRSPGASIAALGVVLALSTIVLFVVDLEARYHERIATRRRQAGSPGYPAAIGCFSILLCSCQNRTVRCAVSSDSRR